jgi:hypothetical protein
LCGAGELHQCPGHEAGNFGVDRYLIEVPVAVVNTTHQQRWRLLDGQPHVEADGIIEHV